jgi:predicted AAA+ superfamily ATPase
LNIEPKLIILTMDESKTLEIENEKIEAINIIKWLLF